MASGGFGVEENILFNAYEFNVWAIMKKPKKYMYWVDLITLGSKINGPIHNPLQTYINIINTITAGITNRKHVTSIE
jgi:hypothetical protein